LKPFQTTCHHNYCRRRWLETLRHADFEMITGSPLNHQGMNLYLLYHGFRGALRNPL
jgi:hypothetical protein